MITAEKAKTVIAELFCAYDADPALMSAGWLSSLPQEEPARSRHIADFIAGMTDRYAMDQHARIYETVPEGLSNV
jgi:dGTPase